MREIKLRHKTTREGPYFHVSLFDDRGRFVLSARVAQMDDYIAKGIGEYLETGHLTFFPSMAIKRALSVD